MNFGLSEEQTILKSSIGRYLEEKSPLERIHRFADGGETRARDVWSGLCASGIPGLLIDERHGGVGLGLIDAALVAETLGYHAAPVPFVSTMVMTPLALAMAGSQEQKSQWLAALAEGRIVAGGAVTEVVSSRLDAQVTWDGKALNGKTLFVLDFEADLYLVADTGRSLYLVESGATGLRRQLLKTIDKTRRVGELTFDNVAAQPLPGSSDPEVCARVVDAARIVLAADTLGAAQNMLEKAVAYSKQRKQFGRPIGSFQAVKHMCAEMAADLEPCRAMMWYAAHAFDHIEEEARLTACHAKAHISEVATFVAKTATEVHGGIGFTHDLGLHFWFKRIGANRQLLGGPETLREEAARLQELV